MDSIRDTMSTLGVELNGLLAGCKCQILPDWHSIVTNCSFSKENDTLLILRAVISHPYVDCPIIPGFQNLLKRCLALQIQVICAATVE
jgi:hypothetical protein